MRRAIFCDTAPVATPGGNGLVFLTFDGANHPAVAVPFHVARAFCEITARKLDTWEREQAMRGVVVGMERRGHS